MDELSFSLLALRLFVAVRDSAVREIVRRELHENAVSGQNADEVHPDLSRHVSEHFVPVREFDAKHRVRKGLDDRPLDFDRLFFGCR